VSYFDITKIEITRGENHTLHKILKILPSRYLASHANSQPIFLNVISTYFIVTTVTQANHPWNSICNLLKVDKFIYECADAYAIVFLKFGNCVGLQQILTPYSRKKIHVSICSRKPTDLVLGAIQHFQDPFELMYTWLCNRNGRVSTFWNREVITFITYRDNNKPRIVPKNLCTWSI